MMANKNFFVAVVGRNAHFSGWTSLLQDDGIPVKCFTDIQQLEAIPSFIIFVNQGNPPGHQWDACPALYDYQYPPDTRALLLAWAENLDYEGGTSFTLPFNAWVTDWEGDSFGYFRLAREGESPQYPLACYVDQDIYVLGNIAETLNAHGYSFRPSVTDGECELHLIHPPGRKELLRHFMRNLLKSAFKRADIPYVRLAACEPETALSFIFRVDVDYLEEPEMKKIRKIAIDNNFRMTLFVNISGEEKWEDDISFTPGTCQPLENLHFLKDALKESHEIASHGFYHSVTPGYRNTFEDIHKAKNILESLTQAEIFGHVFPGGVWHTHAARAAFDAGIKYTSEASIAWGGNPFSMSPPGNNHFPVQIPCSPLYPSYHQMGNKQIDRFIELFESIARKATEDDEPLSLMGHPFDMEDLTPFFWDSIKGIVDTYGFKPAVMSDLFRAYKRKQQVQIRIYNDSGDWYVKTDYPWEIITDAGKFQLLPDKPPFKIESQRK
jgi:hypothetical protein